MQDDAVGNVGSAKTRWCLCTCVTDCLFMASKELTAVVANGVLVLGTRHHKENGVGANPANVQHHILDLVTRYIKQI